jgi:hypothetical protein
MEFCNQLANYYALCERVEVFAQQVVNAFATSMACRPGCDSCCRHLALFPVEAYALAVALAALPIAGRDVILARAGAATDVVCPLLVDGCCLLYAARPLICRTHGLPLLVATAGGKRIDFCPKNFSGISSFPGSAVLDLQQLNTVLAAVNANFVHAALTGNAPERLTIAEALLLRQ